jgi:hypothetical protein
MKAFDDYEIHGVAEFTDLLGNRYCEPVPDDEAQFWSLYGHIPGQGLECIGDFKTRKLAEEVLARITGGPTTRELLHALLACIWWWDTQPALVRNLEEPEAFVRGRALVARAVAA